jgi:hypothetical protein
MHPNIILIPPDKTTMHLTAAHRAAAEDNLLMYTGKSKENLTDLLAAYLVPKGLVLLYNL